MPVDFNSLLDSRFTILKVKRDACCTGLRRQWHAEREREIRAERQPGELQMRDAAQDAAERTVVSVLIIIFLHVLAGAAVVRSLQSSRTDSR